MMWSVFEGTFDWSNFNFLWSIQNVANKIPHKKLENCVFYWPRHKGLLHSCHTSKKTDQLIPEKAFARSFMLFLSTLPTIYFYFYSHQWIVFSGTSPFNFQISTNAWALILIRTQKAHASRRLPPKRLLLYFGEAKSG